MEHLSTFESVLSDHFASNKSHLPFISRSVLALLQARDVNLVKVSQHLNPALKDSSNYRNLQYFFSNEDTSFDPLEMGRFVLSLLPKRRKYLLAMDRTEWKRGKKTINILMISVVYGEIASPLFWEVLDKDGSSNWKECVALLETCFSLLPPDRIEALLADREFIGGPWFQWLSEQGLSFCIRVKSGHNVFWDSEEPPIKIKSLFNDLKRQESKYLCRELNVYQNPVFLAGHRNPKGHLLAVATDTKPKKALKRYLKRWKIETLFLWMKSKGFQMENTHITAPDRIAKLVGLLTIAFCWAYYTGKAVQKKKPTPVKNHGRKLYSTFRRGMDALEKWLKEPGIFKQELAKSILRLDQRCPPLLFPA